MATIKFFLRSNSNPANIYVRLVDGRKADIMCKSNYIIDPKNWDPEKQSPKNLKNVHSKNLDVDLAVLRTNILIKYNSKKDDIINTDWLKKIINPETVIDVPNGLVKYFDYYLTQREHEISPGTKRKIKVVQSKLKKFEKSTRTTFTIKDVNLKFSKLFFEYNKDNNYSENTIYENLKEIKTVCRHAAKKGIVLAFDFNEIKTPKQKAASIFLTFEELKKIKATKLELDYLDNARDWLLISCFTAQRVSDFMRFTKEMIRVQDGKKLIEFTQVKTGKIMTLPLHPEVLEILEKRGGNFPRKTSDQRYNEYIKLVCKAAKIEDIVYGGKMEENRKVLKGYPKHELVSSHVGRRSFASNFYGIIPTSLLISATGHATEQMFLVYIGKSNTDKAMQLSEFF